VRSAVRHLGLLGVWQQSNSLPVSYFYTVVCFAQYRLTVICMHINGICLKQLASVSVLNFRCTYAVVVSVSTETEKSGFGGPLIYQPVSITRSGSDLWRHRRRIVDVVTIPCLTRSSLLPRLPVRLRGRHTGFRQVLKQTLGILREHD